MEDSGKEQGRVEQKEGFLGCGEWKRKEEQESKEWKRREGMIGGVRHRLRPE
jgi:hypothetical protein